MARFRRNHSKSGTAAANVVRISLLAAIILTTIFLFYFFGSRPLPPPGFQKPALPNYLPASSTGIVFGKDRYWISWESAAQLPEWVACLITPDQTQILLPDLTMQEAGLPSLEVQTPADNTPFENTLLLPLQMAVEGENKFKNPLYLGSFCPQYPDFKYFREEHLNLLLQRWVQFSDTLIVVAGPVLGAQNEGTRNAPEAYFLVLLAKGGNKKTSAIGFIFPHQPNTTAPAYRKFAVSVNQVEQVTGLDFFSKFFDDTLEEALESDFNLNLWPDG
jgi:endonuclease G